MMTSRPILLLIDDEPFVRDSLGRLLARHLTVIPAASAEEGLELLEAHPEIDAILSDVTMPGLGAAGLLPRLPPRYLQRIALMTGGISNPEVRRFLSNVCHPILYKPFTSHEVLDLLMGMLSGLGDEEETADLLRTASAGS